MNHASNKLHSNENYPLTSLKNQSILRFYLPFFAVVYLVAWTVPEQLKFATTIILIIVGYYVVVIFLIRYHWHFSSVAKSNSSASPPSHHPPMAP